MHAAAKILQDFNERNINFAASFLCGRRGAKLSSSGINTRSFYRLCSGGFQSEVFSGPGKVSVGFSALSAELPSRSFRTLLERRKNVTSLL